ncbi:MAG: hypothetical protein EZS28_024797 [Streblomastix strix]|uniref:Macro domain-containing protein n=1 Tax=Streblomastix strix TaxID=222440 RepID=A0A5J4VAW6_9EUKA|nr:MAG: hypothetical protein EZS28_024797 [Streblomastix strix]
MDSGSDGTQNTANDVVEPSQSQMGASPGPTGIDALNFITPAQDEQPCIRYRPISSYEGMTIATPRVSLFPPLHQHQVFGTTKKENPAQSPQELLDLMYMDFANRSYVTFATPHQPPKVPQPEVVPKVEKQPEGDQQPQEEEDNKNVYRILAASLTPKQGIDQPFRIKQPTDASQIEPANIKDLVYGTGEEIDQSLSIHTAQFNNASTQQMQSTFLQDLSMPSQTISCEKFLDWTNYISTWTVDERKEMEAKTSVARFANLGYYRPEIDIEDDINQRIFVIQGDITAIECDAIVNVTDEQLNVESLVSQAILARGGIKMQKAMKKLSLSTGECRMTKGYRLPVKRTNINEILH